jgi:hypothetical protein
MAALSNATPASHVPFLKDVAFVLKIVLAEHLSEAHELSDSGTPSDELMAEVFHLLREALVGCFIMDDLKLDSFGALWDNLLLGKPFSTIDGTKEIISSIFMLVWTENWSRISHFIAESDSDSTIGLLPLIIVRFTLLLGIKWAFFVLLIQHHDSNHVFFAAPNVSN